MMKKLNYSIIELVAANHIFQSFTHESEIVDFVVV
jgi:hypothetical protein